MTEKIEKTMEAKISEIQIFPIKPNNGLVGFASFVLNGYLYLGSIGIFTRPEGGFRLLYPTKKLGIKNFNIYFPINKEFSNTVDKVIIKKFEDVMNNDRYNSSNS